MSIVRGINLVRIFRKGPGIEPNDAATGTLHETPNARRPIKAVLQATIEWCSRLLAQEAGLDLLDSDADIRSHPPS
jgi:hypothetical protein